MRFARVRRLPPFYLIFSLILVSALALGRYSYRSARLLAEQSERPLSESNRLVGEQIRNRIDNFIIDTDRSLLDIVDLDHLQDFARRWTEIVRLSAAIDAAIVLDANHDIVEHGYVTKQGAQSDRFRKLFKRKILPRLELDHLQLELHKHLHIVVDGHDYLISYIKREQRATASRPGRVYYVALKINLDYLVHQIFPKTFAPLEGKVAYAVVNSRDRVIYGAPVQEQGSLLYSEPFPTTLYLWRLQIAPLGAAGIARETHKRLLSDSTLIGLMVATILVGIMFLVYAVAAERRANQLKSEFISNVSHELKTPLSLIRMFGELLATNKVRTPETGREYAAIITRESERLSRLIDNVLDFSRIERGKASYEFSPGDLAEVLARAIDVYKLRFEREGVTLTTEVEPELPEILFDESALTLVILNLLDNAMKYGAGEDGCRIHVELRREDGHVRLSVADRGQGIPADEIRHIFDRFYRSKAARAQNARGSGIGLSLVKHIAEAHGGHVSVESAPGRGATFVVTIPMLKRPEGASESGPEGAPRATSEAHAPAEQNPVARHAV